MHTIVCDFADICVHFFGTFFFRFAETCHAYYPAAARSEFSVDDFRTGVEQRNVVIDVVRNRNFVICGVFKRITAARCDNAYSA